MTTNWWQTSLAIVAAAWVVAAAWRFARRRAGPGVAAVEAMGVACFVQYAAVCIAGVFNMLTGAVVATLSIAAGAGLLLWARKTPVPAVRTTISRQGRLAIAVVLAVMAGHVWLYRWTPPTANDSLIYHLPAAVQWLQDRSLTVFEPWIHNPANAWSPLAGTTYACWSMAIAGHDLFARFIQMPFLALLGAGTWLICRAMGARGWSCLWFAVAVIFCRTTIAQLPIAKDDMIANTLLVASIACLTPAALASRGSAVRFGIVLGLLLATKYPVVYLVLPLLLGIDQPWRQGKRWRWYAVAIGVAFMVCGPWYVRNAIVFGNPVFPMYVPGLGGILSTRPAEEYRAIGPTLRILTSTYFAIPTLLAVVLVIFWLPASVWLRANLRDPMRRMLTFGAVLLLAAYLVTSPVVEVRYISSVVALMIGAIASTRFRVIAAPTCAAAAVATAYYPDMLRELLPLILPPLLGFGLLAVVWVRIPGRVKAGVGVGLATALLAVIYVFHDFAIRTYRISSYDTWSAQYGPIADAWRYVAAQSLPGQSIAYAGTTYVYPLQDADHRVAFVSPSPTIATLRDLPPLRNLVADKIDEAVYQAVYADPDQAVWLERLAAASPDLLFVAKEPRRVPELDWANASPQRFQLLFDNEAAAVYRLR